MKTLCLSLLLATASLWALADDAPPQPAQTPQPESALGTPPPPPAPAGPPSAAGPPPAAGPRRGEMRGKNDDVTNPPKELLEQIMMARVTQEVGLNDEQTVLLLRRFNATRERMAQLRKERAAAIKELRELVNKDKENTEVEAKLQALMNIDERLASTRREAYDQVSAGLTPWQRAKLYIFTSEFESELRAVVQRARERLQQGRNGAGPAAENGDAAPLPGEGRRLGRMLRGERPGAPPAPNEAR